MTGWKHEQAYQLPIKPSPNLPNELSVKLYPSLCFFEATNVSIGRGTVYPFQIIGAPEKKYGKYSFTPQSLPGWEKNPLHQNKVCYGIDLRNTDFQGGLSLKFLLDFYKLSNENASFFSRPEWFDLLAGNKFLRKQIISGMDESKIRKHWVTDLNNYKELRNKYLLYPLNEN